MSVFIACNIPKNTILAIRDGMRSYQHVLATSVPQEKWHCTILFLGNIELSDEMKTILTQPIRQPFHCILTVLSLGQGQNKKQLWAYIQTQQLLTSIRQELIYRARIHEPKEFIPHINVGALENQSDGRPIPDMPVKATWSVSELLLLQSNPNNPGALYEQLGTIPITP
ncbi:MAG TPA: hypothetical protein VLG69_02185 [Candidatus Andersenbacteria bacterium]|nr:hypothetical protein [Candidatus Andersenbacteria bacterium]